MSLVFGRDRLCKECKGSGERSVLWSKDKVTCTKCQGRGWLSDQRFEMPEEITIRDERGGTIVLDVDP